MLNEMELDDDIKNVWLEPLEEIIEDQIKELEYNYKDKIENIINKLHIDKEIKQRFKENYRNKVRNL